MLWQERFTANPAWQSLAEARSNMDASVMPEEAAEQDALSYAGWVLELVEKRRSESDPHEITPTMLSNLNSAVATFSSYIANVNNGSYTWSAVTAYADSVLDALAAWPPLKISHYMSGMHSAVESFQTKSTEAVNTVRENAAALAEELQATADRQDGVKELVEVERQRITEAIATFTTESAEAIAQVREDQEERLVALSDRWADLEREASARADASVARLEGHEKEARNVVQSTTSHIVATDYGKYARNKTIAAWACDIAAATIGAAGLAVIVYHLLSLDPEADANIGLSLTRLAVSLGTLGVAGLLGHRGQQHHLEARAAKRTDLALRQVLPFTANLDEEDRREIVREFTERVFIRGDIDIPKSLRPRVSLRRPRPTAASSGNDSAAE